MKAGTDKPEDIIKGVLVTIYSSLAEPAAKWTKHKRLYDKYGALRGVPAEGVAENAGRRLERGGDFPLLYGELKKRKNILVHTFIRK